MTGYGAGDAPLGEGRVDVEVRAVNHRFLDVRVRLPRELADHAVLVEDLVRRRLDRGRIDVSARVEGDACGPPELDPVRARVAFEALSALRDELRPGEPVPLTLLACVPELFRTSPSGRYEDTRVSLERAVIAACAALERMRGEEGNALAADFRGRVAKMQASLEIVRERGPGVVDAYRRKLHDRIGQLLRGHEVALDPARLEHEVVLFADRMDVAEEITRLASHLGQVARIIDGEPGAVGRRLDFLLQEMAREVNTLGAKSPDVEITRAVIELKADVERLREQAQNVL